MNLRIELDRTMTRYPYVVVDEKNRWIKVFETRIGAEVFIQENQ